MIYPGCCPDKAKTKTETAPSRGCTSHHNHSKAAPHCWGNSSEPQFSEQSSDRLSNQRFQLLCECLLEEQFQKKRGHRIGFTGRCIQRNQCTSKPWNLYVNLCFQNPETIRNLQLPAFTWPLPGCRSEQNPKGRTSVTWNKIEHSLQDTSAYFATPEWDWLKSTTKQSMNSHKAHPISDWTSHENWAGDFIVFLLESRGRSCITNRRAIVGCCSNQRFNHGQNSKKGGNEADMEKRRELSPSSQFCPKRNQSNSQGNPTQKEPQTEVSTLRMLADCAL